MLFMVHLSGKTGPSLSHSLRQVMNLDPTECLTMGEKALPGGAVHQMVYVVHLVLVQLN